MYWIRRARLLLLDTPLRAEHMKSVFHTATYSSVQIREEDGHWRNFSLDLHMYRERP